MGKEKTTVGTSTTATATPEEQELNRIQLERIKGNQANQQSLDSNLYNVMNTILTGGQLNGNLQGINGIGEDQTKAMATQAVQDIAPQFQQGGILDSGVAAALAAKTAGNIRNQNAQFNVVSLQNLFNQALGGSSNLGNAATNQSQVLGGQLAGLRQINSTQTTLGQNPFLKNLQSSAGTSLGNGTFGNKNGWFSV
jgi:hypothetical protein